MSEESIEKLKQRYRKSRDFAPGATHPGEPLFEKDPYWFEKYQKIWEFACGQGKALPVKTRELIMLAATGTAVSAPEAALRGDLDAGDSPSSEG